MQQKMASRSNAVPPDTRVDYRRLGSARSTGNRVVWDHQGEVVGDGWPLRGGRGDKIPEPQ
jgi:hypothetical protein